jgi:glycosyltransferase involved in cell wall biosynthesis
VADHDNGRTPVGVVFARSPALRFVPTIQSLRRNGLHVVVGSDEPRVLDEIAKDADATLHVETVAELVNTVWTAHRTHVVLALDTGIAPDGLLDLALPVVDAEPRVGTVTFWSNAAGPFSFPYWQTAIHAPPNGEDETSLTRKLRALPPAPEPFPIPHCAGPIVLLTASALAAVGAPVDAPLGSEAGLLVDFSLRARRRGFIDILDPGTFVSRPADLSRDQTGSLDADKAWVFDRHPWVTGYLDEFGSRSSTFGGFYTSVASKVTGLRIAMDGAYLGATETGTQVATLETIEAMAKRDDVAEIAVSMHGPVPAYARRALGDPKVRPVQINGNVGALGHVDVAHRPYQPDAQFVPTAWREISDRLVVTILDLIAYHGGAYQRDPAGWTSYRHRIERIAAQADGVFVISADVAEQIRLHRLDVEERRLFPIVLGANHLAGDVPCEPPDVARRDGWSSAPFVVCLGTNFAHKNRDLAVRASRELRSRGVDHTLVLVGPQVAFGSSRLDEIEQLREDAANVVLLPDVPSAQRNWLLAHAAVVLYPTSAEGFGLVPFEAAHLGTPTVYTSFGPLAELGGDPPVRLSGWDPADIADAVAKLLADPDLTAAQIASTMQAGSMLTWERTAAHTVDAYRRVLAMPRRSAAWQTEA